MLGFTLFNLVQASKNGPFVYRTMIEDALVSSWVILLHYLILFALSTRKMPYHKR